MEEDIKILEERIDYFKCHPEGCNWRLSFEDEKDIQALENLIKGYREIEEENRIFALAGSNIALKLHVEKNYIPKSKIKEKLEELEHEKFKRTYLGFFPKNNCENRILLAKIQVLQELMEDK